MKRCVPYLLFLFIICFSTSAFAYSVDVSWDNDSKRWVWLDNYDPVQDVTSQYNPERAVTFNLDLYDDTGNYLFSRDAFCVEFNQTAFSGTYAAQLSDITTDSLTQAAWLMDNFFSDDADQNAALQLAIWDVLDDNLSGSIITNTYITDYPYYTYYTLYMKELAAALETDLGDFTAKNYSIVIFDDNQNMLIHNPVPEPATMLLLGAGLLGMAGIGSKKKWANKRQR